MTKLDLSPVVGEITELVRSAGLLALDSFRQPVAVQNKSGSESIFKFDPVTEADRAVEDHLRSGLAELFSDHAIMGEERGETGTGPWRWVIDPIDGTRAFITGQPMWGTLVGLQNDGKPVAGWMYQPALDDMYRAVNGTFELFSKGDATRVGASAVTELSDSVMLCTHPSMFAPGPQQDGFSRLAGRVKMTRYSGDCANYGFLAAGWADLVVENQLAPYDIIPLIPIVEAAGAVITDLDGNCPTHGGFVVAAATVELHRSALDVLHDRQ